MTDIQLRPATLDDLTYVTSATLALHERESNGNPVVLAVREDFPEQIRHWLQTLITESHALMLIAVAESEPVGFVLGYVQPQPNPFTRYDQHGVIQLLWVESEWRKQGLATQMVEAMESCFAELGVPYCEISHAMSNDDAAGFWQDRGYQPDHVVARKFLAT